MISVEKHKMYTYDRCTDRYNMVEGTTITSSRNIIHYASSDYVLTPLWSIIGSDNRRKDKLYQITKINSADDMREAKEGVSLKAIKTTQSNGSENILQRMNLADYSFTEGYRNFGFSEEAIITLAEDNNFNIYVAKKKEKGGSFLKLKTESILSLLAVPCGYLDGDIVYTKYIGENKKMVSEKYGTTCGFDVIRGYNDKYIYFERSGRTYVVGFDLHNAENFDNIFKKYKGIKPYYIDFSDDTIYYYLEQEQIIIGYDLSGNQVDEWKVPSYDNNEVLMFVGKKLFIALGRIYTPSNEQVQNGFVRQYNREGKNIEDIILDENYGMAGGTYVDYIAGEPCILGGPYNKAVILTVRDATPIFKYAE